ncbi:endonuclease III domain-containing protein [Nitratireductor kimnyeongensis]|uniref:Endonuclease III domain-containing protein n=1 Tax=Nitratireductor kimnyeongensis TaxID=430679 RepID=A0ABW0T4E2_9HYPH|nr:iron-sulfur cluster loop [Nitratireductor kimnyeongensis]QZZ34962.1 iron-sulfur cluster loop [Nitratireductor kimnyeongensis]
MQYTLPLVPFDRLESLHQRLLAVFGPPEAFARLDPVSQMLLAMLSARTRNETALAVFVRLVEHFEVTRLKGSWVRLAEASFHELDPLLEGITHADRKAVALPRALQEIASLSGDLSLDFLHEWPVDDALVWLERLYGVGPKTSTATLNMSTLRKRILVVDTAHWRAARCLGLVPERASPERSVRLLNRQVPDRWGAGETEQHHILMQDLGRNFCARKNRVACPFARLCVHGVRNPTHRPDRLLEDFLHMPLPLPDKREKVNPISLLKANAENLNPGKSTMRPMAQSSMGPATPFGLRSEAAP